jgi:hypothetical protein
LFSEKESGNSKRYENGTMAQRLNCAKIEKERGRVGEWDILKA